MSLQAWHLYQDRAADGRRKIILEIWLMFPPPLQTSVVMQRLSYPTETVLSNMIIGNTYNSPTIQRQSQKPLRRRPSVCLVQSSDRRTSDRKKSSCDVAKCVTRRSKSSDWWWCATAGLNDAQKKTSQKILLVKVNVLWKVYYILLSRIHFSGSQIFMNS